MYIVTMIFIIIFFVDLVYSSASFISALSESIFYTFIVYIILLGAFEPLREKDQIDIKTEIIQVSNNFHIVYRDVNETFYDENKKVLTVPKHTQIITSKLKNVVVYNYYTCAPGENPGDWIFDYKQKETCSLDTSSLLKLQNYSRLFIPSTSGDLNNTHMGNTSLDYLKSV